MPSPAVYNETFSREESRSLNNSPYQFDRNISRNPENMLTIFTVNTRSQFSTSAGMMFAGREPQERYRKVGGPVPDPKYFTDNLAVEGSNDQKRVIPDDGEWVVMDWLNPNNTMKLDQDFVVPTGVDDGTDLLARGLFYIKRPFNPQNGNLQDKPTEDEIKAAEKRLAKRYTMLKNLYMQTSTANPAKLPNIMTEEMIDALNFAGLKTPFNTVLEQKITCPTCGEPISPNAKFHKSESLGVICIQPTVEGWKDAVAANIKTREQASEAGFTWPGRSAGQ